MLELNGGNGMENENVIFRDADLCNYCCKRLIFEGGSSRGKIGAGPGKWVGKSFKNDESLIVMISEKKYLHDIKF